MHAGTNSSQPSPINDPEAYAVYAALLDNHGSPFRELVVSETEQRRLCFDPNSKSDIRIREAAQDFAVENARVWSLSLEKLSRNRKLEPITRATEKGIFSSGPIQGWKIFHQTYPDFHVILDLSAVGFNKDHTFAVVYSGNSCGPLCGAGSIKTLSKVKGVWQINRRDDLCGWIS